MQKGLLPPDDRIAGEIERLWPDLSQLSPEDMASVAYRLRELMLTNAGKVLKYKMLHDSQHFRGSASRRGISEADRIYNMGRADQAEEDARAADDIVASVEKSTQK